MTILDNCDCTYASSLFLKLEVMPKAVYYQNSAEVEFYKAFFNVVMHWANDYNHILKIAYQEASQSGLSAVDAIHVAAAFTVNADELVTTEKSNKPIHRTKLIKVVSIQPVS